MQKFVSQINHAIQQVTGNVKLPIPDVEIDPDNLEAAAADDALVAILEGACDEWITLIKQVIET